MTDIIKVFSEVYHERVAFRAISPVMPPQMFFKPSPCKRDALIFETGTAIVNQVLFKYRYHDFIGKCVLKHRIPRLHCGDDSFMSVLDGAKF